MSDSFLLVILLSLIMIIALFGFSSMALEEYLESKQSETCIKAGNEWKYNDGVFECVRSAR